MIDKWDKRFFELATLVSGWSKDRSTKTGAVIVRDRQVLSLGYNGFSIGINDDIESRHERPIKYSFTEHAERNSLYNAINNGSNIKGATMYTTFFPCTDCCRGIIQTGIIRVVSPEPIGVSEVWRESFQISKEMFEEVGITIDYI